MLQCPYMLPNDRIATRSRAMFGAITPDDQSARAPDSLANFPQRTSSSFRKLANASGDLMVIASTPTAVKRSFTSGDVAAFTRAACSFSTMGRGVFAGAMTANQFTESNLGRPCSAEVGIAGSRGLRLSLVT